MNYIQCTEKWGEFIEQTLKSRYPNCTYVLQKGNKSVPYNDPSISLEDLINEDCDVQIEQIDQSKYSCSWKEQELKYFIRKKTGLSIEYIDSYSCFKNVDLNYFIIKFC